MERSSWFRGLKGRLLAIAILPVIGFLTLFFTSYYGIQKTNSLLETVNQQLLPNTQAMGEMRQSRNKFMYQAWASLSDWENSEKKKARIAQAKEAYDEFFNNYKAYTEAPFQPGEEAIHDKVKGSMPRFSESMKEIIAILGSTNPEDAKKARALLEGDFSKIGSQIRDFNRDVAQLYVKISKEFSSEAQETRQFVTTTLVSVTVISCALILGILLWVASQISNKVGAISQNISGAGSQVSQSVGQLNQAGQSLSSASSEAAASLEETVASLEELTSMVQLNTENAKMAATLSGKSRDTAEKGEQEIQNLIRSMKQISDSSRKIEEIINVIDDIAFQTNLLALNAAVESARAGEQGKGFAVVADAVRSLAQRSADAAKDISVLIQSSVRQIEEGSEIADRSGTVLSTIVDSVKKVSQLNEEIATASQDQATGIAQIGKAMNQLDQAVQSNAAAAEQIAATGEEINSLAKTSNLYSIELSETVLGTMGETIEKAA